MVQELLIAESFVSKPSKRHTQFRRVLPGGFGLDKVAKPFIIEKFKVINLK
jgi:hypothetical protein